MRRPRAQLSEGLPPPGAGPVEQVRNTRKPLEFWDRIKILVLLALIWVLLVWAMMANNPLVGFSDAVKTQVHEGFWVFILIGLEAVRQVHFVICEHWAAYNRFWGTLVFGGIE